MKNVAKGLVLKVISPRNLFLGLGLFYSTSSVTAMSAPLPSSKFLKYWKSGLAEISSYSLVTERYGELRKGQGVLVFVYEEINADTRIKVETNRTPLSKQVPVLKLNNVLKFNTGIYDYSVMTSVFSGLSGKGVSRSFEPQKISFTSQEWCGQVFHQIIPRKQGLVSEIHSYFEAEGDETRTLAYPAGPIYYQDEMPILVRELDGEILPMGMSKAINLVPGLWERRKRHLPLAFTKAVLTKVGAESVKIGSEIYPALKWTLVSGSEKTTYFIEAANPHKLLAWENNAGEKAELVSTIRNSYWGHNRNADEPFRKKLKLNYGVGAGD
jgi:hypothetical protein